MRDRPINLRLVSFGNFVYPACAGIDLDTKTVTIALERLPRMRGDRPSDSGKERVIQRFTPHARGSTSTTFSKEKVSTVYPACAGIDPV